MTEWVKSLICWTPLPETLRPPDIYECGGRYKNICEFPNGTNDQKKLVTVGDYNNNLDMCKSCAREYRIRQSGGGRRGKRRKSKNRKSIYKGERITKKRTTKKRKTNKRKTKKMKN